MLADTADRSAWKESDGDSPDTRAVKYLLKQGVSRIAALEVCVFEIYSRGASLKKDQLKAFFNRATVD